MQKHIKARLDGEYVKNKGFKFDVKCFIGTFASVLKSDGVVEGGTGELKKNKGKKTDTFPLRHGVPEDDPKTPLGFSWTYDFGCCCRRCF